MSKGSRPRPFSVTQEEYNNRWDAIFARDLKDTPSREHSNVLQSTADENQRLELYNQQPAESPHGSN